jgi:hypothetical protein
MNKKPDLNDKINDFIRSNPTLPNKELSARIKTTFKKVINAEACRKRRIRMGLNDVAEPKKLLVKAITLPLLTTFLAKAKTEREISSVYGSLKVLEENFKGYTLFKQRNHYNELMYVLLPIFTDREVVLKEKIFQHHIGKSEEGITQPYILCQLPEFKGTLKIALLFDVHYGNFAHKHEKFLSYLNWIKENDDVYAILGGDLMENALDDGRGMTYDQDKNPQSQFDDMVHFLAPISHKILFATTGNHEERTYKKTGIDIMRLLADRIKVPYFSGAIWASIMANGHKWNLYVQHGHGNSQTKGGKMNSANRPKKFTGLIHFFISGHVHDRVCESETLITDDPINCRLVYLDQWTIIAPAFLGWEDTYAYRAGYPPPARGGVAVELLDDGGYRGSLT